MGVVYRALDRLRGQAIALKSISTLAAMADVSIPVESMGQIGQVQTAPLAPMVTEPMSWGVPRTGLMTGAPVRQSQGPVSLRLALAQEFRTLASLRHPHIITVLDYGFDAQKTPFFTMELLSNARPLMHAAQGLGHEERIELLLQVTQALVYLHRRGVLHRDLKPANILVVPGSQGQHVRVVDFGLAVVKSMDTAGGGLAGTLPYMAPELLRGEVPSEAADLYAVGVMAYELLLGRSPYEGKSTEELIRAVLGSDPDVSDPSIPPALRSVLSRLLSKDPRARIRDAAELCALLAAAVGRPSPPETSVIRDSFLQAAAFVARDEEVALFMDALDEVEVGRGSGWLVGGESGVGKSRFIEEVCTLARVRGAQVLRGESLRAGAASYQPFRDVLRGLCLQIDCDDAQASLLTPVVPDLPVLLQRDLPDPPAVDAKTAQERLLRTIDDCFGLVQSPTVVVIEDVQWAGVEVILMLSRLMRSVRRRPLVIIASFRDDEAPWVPSALPAMELVRLTRLDRISVSTLSQSMLGPLGSHPDLIELLLRETEGNAFFMVEVLRTLAEERGMLSEIVSNRLPERVFAGGMRTVLEHRLSRVPAQARPLLLLAAVMGRQLDLRLLRTREPLLDAWLQTCANVAVLETVNEDWRFSHDKLRERLLEDLSPDQRRQLHQEAAELLQQVRQHGEPDPSLLAYHYREAGIADLAVHYATVAGERALREGAIEKALTYLNDLPRWQDQIANQASLAPGYRLAGSALLALGRITESASRFAQAWSILGFPLPPEQEASAAILADIRRAVQTLLDQPGLTSPPGQEATRTALAMIELTAQSLDAFLQLGRHSTAYRICLIAQGLVERLRLPSLQPYFSLHLQYLHRLYSVENPAAAGGPAAAPAMTDREEDGGALRELSDRLDGMILMQQGQLDLAVEKFQSAAQAASIQGDELHALLCERQLALAHVYRGQLEQAQQAAAKLHRHALSYGSSQFQAWAHTIKALVLLRRSQTAAARSEIDAARKNLERVDDPLCSLHFCGVQAQQLVHQADWPAAAQAVARGVALLDEHRFANHEAAHAAITLAEVYLSLPVTTASPDDSGATLARHARLRAHIARLASLYPQSRARALLCQGLQSLQAAELRRGVALTRLGLRYARRGALLIEQVLAHHLLSRSARQRAVQAQHEQQGRELAGRVGMPWPPPRCAEAAFSRERKADITD